MGTSPKDSKEAERLVKQSIVEYNVGDFDAALADVTKAYKLRPAPALLFNIGQCHRALHNWEKAQPSLLLQASGRLQISEAQIWHWAARERRSFQSEKDFYFLTMIFF